MSLAPGTRLGPYEVVAAAGAGGMGEVYRARDTRLERTVALKVLPQELSASPEVRQRFEREAKAISQLSHPHICAVYDVGRAGDTDYLVMEFLEGEVLSDRLARGPLPIDEVLRYGIQIADALDRAHRNGIVHRDLKPGNIMLTRSGAKLLDFGLAKTLPTHLEPGPAGSEPTAPPTRADLTQEGTILGTVQYMAPEQLEGKDTDARTDIFALGAVLYEMVTGRKAFAATSQASIITAIMSSEPVPLSSVQPATPPLLDRLVHACLAKNRDDRMQTAHDVRLQLRWIAEGSQAGTPVGMVPPPTISRKGHDRLAWGVAAVALAAAASLGASKLWSTPTPMVETRRVVRSTILLPDKVGLSSAEISPDGSRIVFGGPDAAGKLQLWVRPLDSDTATPLSGTESGILPFWSPDGRYIGFFADRKLKRIEAAGGGAALSLYDIDGVGGTWAPSGDILFSAPSGPILRLPANGGAASPVTTLDAGRGENAHRYPYMLPDGRHFLYLALKLGGTSRDPANRIWVGSIDGGAAMPLLPANFNAQYADGYLVFVRGGDQSGSLLAQPFDAARLETTGDTVTVAEHIALNGDHLGLGRFSVSTNGSLLYDDRQLYTQLEVFDRTGRKFGSMGEATPAFRFSPRLSPDGSRVAFDAYDPGTQTTQVWIGDLSRGVETRLTSPPGSNAGPIWSPDSTRVAFQSDRKHQADIYIRRADGTGADQAVTDEEGQKIPSAWSSDGRFVIAFNREAAGERLVGISAFPLDGDRTPLVVVPRRTDNIGDISLSPDRRWLAYDTSEGRRREVYVVSFPDGQQKVQISNTGGLNPKWTRNGRELLYLGYDRRVVAVAIDGTGGLRAATPAPLFSLPEGSPLVWDAAPDGERMLTVVPVLRSSSVPLSLVQNWSAAIR